MKTFELKVRESTVKIYHVQASEETDVRNVFRNDAEAVDLVEEYGLDEEIVSITLAQPVIPFKGR